MLCISHQNLFSYTVHVHLVHSAAGFKEPFGMLIYIFYAVFYCAHYHCHHFGAYCRHVSLIIISNAVCGLYSYTLPLHV